MSKTNDKDTHAQSAAVMAALEAAEVPNVRFAARGGETPVGHFDLLNVTQGGPDTVAGITVVPESIRFERALWGDTGTVNCRSHDLQFGDGNPGGVCAECPLANTRCRVAATLVCGLVVDTDTMLRVTLRFGWQPKPIGQRPHPHAALALDLTRSIGDSVTLGSVSRETRFGVFAHMVRVRP